MSQVSTTIQFDPRWIKSTPQRAAVAELGITRVDFILTRQSEQVTVSNATFSSTTGLYSGTTNLPANTEWTVIARVTYGTNLTIQSAPFTVDTADTNVYLNFEANVRGDNRPVPGAKIYLYSSLADYNGTDATDPETGAAFVSESDSWVASGTPTGNNGIGRTWIQRVPATFIDDPAQPEARYWWRIVANITEPVPHFPGLALGTWYAQSGANSVAPNLSATSAFSRGGTTVINLTLL